MSEEWTEEELAQLPSTTAVFEPQKLNINDHVWIQQGYDLIDQCCGHPPLHIPSGKLLVKDKGGYHIVDEVTRK